MFVKFYAATSDKKKTETSKNKTVSSDTLINPLLNEAKALIINAAHSKASKEEILFAIQRLFSSEHFQSIETISNKDRINEFILKEFQSVCSIRLSEEDLRVLWI